MRVERYRRRSRGVLTPAGCVIGCIGGMVLWGLLAYCVMLALRVGMDSTAGV